MQLQWFNFQIVIYIRLYNFRLKYKIENSFAFFLFMWFLEKSSIKFSNTFKYKYKFFTKTPRKGIRLSTLMQKSKFSIWMIKGKSDEGIFAEIEVFNHCSVYIHAYLWTFSCVYSSLDSSLRVKVADFGLSRDLYRDYYYHCEDKRAKLPCRWMAPESLERQVYSTKTDVVRSVHFFHPFS